MLPEEPRFLAVRGSRLARTTRFFLGAFGVPLNLPLYFSKAPEHVHDFVPFANLLPTFSKQTEKKSAILSP